MKNKNKSYASRQATGFIAIMLYTYIMFGCQKDEDALASIHQIAFEINHENNFDTLYINNIPYILHNPYKNSGELKLKGSMHNHTNNSIPYDGYGSGDPIWVAEKLRDEGKYDFYTFTDHNYITPDPQIPGIVWMGLSIEDTKKGQHICAYNLPKYKFVDIGYDMFDLLDYYHRLGAFTSLAHPDWQHTYIDENLINKIEKLHFVEVLTPIESNGFRSLDILRSNGLLTFSIGVEDFHYDAAWDDPNKYFNKSWIIAFAEEKEKNSIWKSLLTGAFYASNGPEIEINLHQGSFNITSKEKSSISFICYYLEGLQTTIEINDTHHASKIWTEDLLWMRAKVSNSKGIAFTQAIQLVEPNLLEQ